MNRLIENVILISCEFPNRVHLLFIIIHVIIRASPDSTLSPLFAHLTIHFVSLAILPLIRRGRILRILLIQGIHGHFLHERTQSCLRTSEVTARELAVPSSLGLVCIIGVIGKYILIFLPQRCLLLLLLLPIMLFGSTYLSSLRNSIV